MILDRRHILAKALRRSRSANTCPTQVRSLNLEHLEPREMLAFDLVQTYLSDPSPAPQADHLGSQVVASGDTIVAKRSDEVVIYSLSGAAKPRTLDPLGFPIAMATDGQTLAVAHNSGIDVYDLESEIPILLATIDHSVSTSNPVLAVDGPLVFTATDEVFAFDISDVVPGTLVSEPVLAIESPSPFSDRFGWSVAASDGRVVIGDPHDDGGGSVAGAAYVFNVYSIGQEWFSTYIARVLSQSPNDFSSFGDSVDVDGTLVVIGAPYWGQTPFDDTGIAFVYDVQSAVPGTTIRTPLVTLAAPEPSRFGGRVAIGGTTVVAASPHGRLFAYDLTNFLPGAVAMTSNAVLPESDGTSSTSNPTFAATSDKVVVGLPQYDVKGHSLGAVLVYQPKEIGLYDFNVDGRLDCDDVDELVVAVAAGSTDSTYDLNQDLMIDTADVSEWLLAAGDAILPYGGAYLPGDADLDGFVGARDFLIWNQNKFSPDPAVPGWCQGNFNADGVVDGADFQIWSENKFTSSGFTPAPSNAKNLNTNQFEFDDVLVRDEFETEHVRLGKWTVAKHEWEARTRDRSLFDVVTIVDDDESPNDWDRIDRFFAFGGIANDGLS